MNKQHKQLQCEDDIMNNNTLIFFIARPLSQPTKDLPIEPSKNKQKGKKHVNQNLDSLIKVQFRKPQQAN
jgi:hypothetical protein